MIKRRLEETESDNERLLTQYRTAAKELVLYKSLAEAPDNPDPASKSKDYQQVKASITEVMKENERLQNELQNFKTTDPVYEQVQLLESANQQLKQDIKHLTMEIDRLRVNADPEETKQLKLQLAQSLNEYERIKLINEKLVHQLSTSPKQVCFSFGFDRKLILFRISNFDRSNLFVSSFSFFLTKKKMKKILAVFSLLSTFTREQKRKTEMIFGTTKSIELILVLLTTSIC